MVESSHPASRMQRAQVALEGLSVGDAFGERFFLRPDIALARIEARALPCPPWRYTDDTAMALSIRDVLVTHGRIDQDALATAFAARYAADPRRGYGAGAHDLLSSIARGARWREAAGALFGGSGSYGNGAAMRVAPIGGYFADDVSRAASEARASAEVTHANPEGQAGAIAVAVAAAWAWNQRDEVTPDVDGLFEQALAHTPAGLTRDGIGRARELSRTETVHRAVAELGNGSRISAQDTVPLCLWCIARHSTAYVDALWATVSALGDRDTTCAIVGGVVALAAARNPVPDLWLRAREPLPRGVASA